ncbi:MAG: histidine phosphatase family protein [Cohaesibacter sp.]|nr:histidine phosphatase family protein [Cohaesibacter sp.]
MLRLYLLRHAKSSWTNPALADYDRPLNKRGRKDLPNIAHYMQQQNYQPQRILCSGAMRTRQTLAGILPALTTDCSIQLLSGLYEGYAPDYLLVLRDHAQNNQSVMIVGHNTGMQEIALRLIGAGDRALLNDMEIKFPTGSLAVLDFDVPSWNDVTAQTANLSDFVKPRDLLPPQDPIESPQSEMEPDTPFSDF